MCVGCKPCSITTGFAGAGAVSDGKLSLSPDVGGNLPEILGYEKATERIKESDDIYLQFGADKNVYGVDKQQEIRKIRKKAKMCIRDSSGDSANRYSTKTGNIMNCVRYLMPI